MQNNTWVKYSEEYLNDSMEKSFVFNHKSRQGLKNEHVTSNFKTKQGSRSEGWGTGSDDKADVRAVSFLWRIKENRGSVARHNETQWRGLSEFDSADEMCTVNRKWRVKTCYNYIFHRLQMLLVNSTIITACHKLYLNTGLILDITVIIIIFFF